MFVPRAVLGGDLATSRTPSQVVGMTAPYETATLASVQPARIAQIKLPEGSPVRRGELVVNLDESVQAARTELAKATSQTTLNMDHARAKWEHARRDLDRLMKLHGNEQASSKELSDAVAAEQITRIEYDLAHFNQAQALRAFEREQAALEEFRLRSPFDGYVAQHHKHVAETVNELEGIVTLVQFNPLKVITDCPVELASRIHAGDRFWVRPADSQWAARVGTVILASRVVDAGSQTFKVKLAVDNADAQWMSGMKVVVDFASIVDEEWLPAGISGPGPSRGTSGR